MSGGVRNNGGGRRWIEGDWGEEQ